jgi:TatD DNase family protein
MELFDTHAHLSSPDVLPHIASILDRAQASGIQRIVNICTDLDSLREGLELEKQYLWICNAGATSPHDVDREGEQAFETFAMAAREKKLAAIGETGLDYYYKHSKKTTQREFFVRYLHLASECKRPVIFHCRDAFDDLFAIADSEYPKGAPAIVHCFTGNREDAKKAVDRGWMISLSGILTFKNSGALREAARLIPNDFILLETDTPYLAPQDKRGRPNEPSFMIETAECLAMIRNAPLSEIARMTSDNARRIFQI